jgi:serralysin
MPRPSIRTGRCLAASLFVAGLAVLATCFAGCSPSGVPHLPPVVVGPVHVGPAEVSGSIDGGQVKVCATIDLAAPAPDGVLRLGVVRDQHFEPGHAFRVCWLGGTVQDHARAMAGFRQWEGVCNVRFVDSTDPRAEVRVQFRPGGGSWAKLGRGCLQTPLGQPTMQLDPTWFELSTATHEAGHILGFVHGQNLPNAGDAIHWDVRKVYAYFGGPPNRWDRQTIDVNVFRRFTAVEVEASPFDAQSIMQYPVDASLTTDGYSIGWNTQISTADAAFARGVYPFCEAAPTAVPRVTICPDPRSFLIPVSLRRAG